jgi:hypothetical protein
MFATIRKHQTWLWVIIVTVTIISFVILGPNYTRTGNLGGRSSQYGMLGGKPIAIEQIITAKREVMLGAFFKTQQWPTDLNGFEMNRETYIRLFMLQKVKDLGIVVSTEAVANNVRRILGSGNIDDFETQVLKKENMDIADFERFVRDQISIEQMVRTAGTCGKLVTPQEAETMYRLEHSEVDARLAYFRATNFISSVTVTPEILGQFYTNRMAEYREADKVQVEYVFFNATNSHAAAEASFTNLSQLIDNEVRNRGTNLFAKAKTVEESKKLIREAYIHQKALTIAIRAASKFSETLDSMSPHTLAVFHSLAESNQLTVGTTKPFERKIGPDGMGLEVNGLEFASTAFSLTPQEIFSPSVLSEGGVYLLAFKEHIPSRTPPIAEIKARLEEDYRYMASMQISQQAAVQFSGKLTNGLALGKSFSAICTENGVTATTLPALSLSTRDLGDEIEHGIDLPYLKQVVFSTPVGTSSGPASARDGAFVAYVAKQLPTDEAKVKAELPEFINYVRQVRHNDAFNLWFNSEIRKDDAFMKAFQQMAEAAQGPKVRGPSS